MNSPKDTPLDSASLTNVEGMLQWLHRGVVTSLLSSPSHQFERCVVRRFIILLASTVFAALLTTGAVQASDTTGPVVTIDSAPETATRAGASFAFSSPEADATFRCNLLREADNYSSGWRDCGSNGAGDINYSNLTPDSWIFTVNA